MGVRGTGSSGRGRRRSKVVVVSVALCARVSCVSSSVERADLCSCRHRPPPLRSLFTTLRPATAFFQIEPSPPWAAHRCQAPAACALRLGPVVGGAVAVVPAQVLRRSVDRRDNARGKRTVAWLQPRGIEEWLRRSTKQKPGRPRRFKLPRRFCPPPGCSARVRLGDPGAGLATSRGGEGTGANGARREEDGLFSPRGPAAARAGENLKKERTGQLCSAPQPLLFGGA